MRVERVLAYDIQIDSCFPHVRFDSSGMVLEVLLLECGELLLDLRWKFEKFKSYSPPQITHNVGSIVPEHSGTNIIRYKL